MKGIILYVFIVLIIVWLVACGDEQAARALTCQKDKMHVAALERCVSDMYCYHTAETYDAIEKWKRVIDRDCKEIKNLH
jgi:hypothetical protein